MYSILFGGSGAINVDDSAYFTQMVAMSEGIQALQYSDDEKTITYRIDDETLPEDVRGDATKVAAYLLTKTSE